MNAKKLTAFLSAALMAFTAFGVNSVGEAPKKADISAYAADDAVSKLLPEKTSNIFAVVYDRLGIQEKSHLIANADGTFTRIEATDRDKYERVYNKAPYFEKYCEPYSEKYCVETYSSDLKLISSSYILPELQYIDGFYCGEKYNFVFFVSENEEMDDSAEVFRIVKYSKDWKRLGACSLSAIDTKETTITPRCTEYNGTLYIHTSHTMYSGHQSNMTFAIKESDMTCVQSRTAASPHTTTSYCSHSFDQYVLTDGKSLYTLDLGDAYPRAMSIAKSSLDSIQRATNICRKEIPGDIGDNYTGVNLGGFEMTEKNLIFSGCSVDISDASTYNKNGQRNVFVGIVSKNMGNDDEIKQIYITDYKDGAGITIGVPKLIKLDDNSFIVMWSENVNNTKYVKIDANGKLLSEINEIFAPLSDCKPIIRDDGKLMWYFCDNSGPQFMILDPDKNELASEFTIGGRYDDVASYSLEPDGTLVIMGKGDLDTGATGTITIGIGNKFPFNSIAKRLVISEGITGIGAAYLTEFNAIKELVLPSTLEDISLVGFYRCPALEKIYIKKGISYIGKKAFDECSSITDVYYSGTEEDWNKIRILEENAPLLAAKFHYNYISKIPSGVKGDANYDGFADIADIVTLQKWILGNGALAGNANADMDGDGIIDAFDLALLRRYVITKFALLGE